jgi:hypothetical protein
MFKVIDKFSFYVLIWYFLYILNILPFNPILTFYLITIFMSSVFIYLIYCKISLKKLRIFFIYGIFVIKILPIITLKHEININDIIFGFMLYFTYNIFLFKFYKIETLALYYNFTVEYIKISDDILYKKIKEDLVRIC